MGNYVGATSPNLTELNIRNSPSGRNIASTKVGAVEYLGKRQFSWLELLSGFVAMGVIAGAYFALPKRYHLKPDWEEAAVCVMIASVFVIVGWRSLWRDIAFWIRADPFLCHSIGHCSRLGAASGRTEPWRWEAGYACRFRFDFRDIRMYQAVAAEHLWCR